MGQERSVMIVGGGPAGLMAATVLAESGVAVTVYERMPTVGRKLLVAGRGGLNLTHGEPLDGFVSRYGDRAGVMASWVRGFPPEALRAWAADLGVEMFVGSSGRVFPVDLKAARLLRGWVHRLRESGVRFRHRYRFVELTERVPPTARFETPEGERVVAADAIVFAMGGASYSRMGADGRWVEAFTKAGIRVRPLEPSNVGFETAWSAPLRERAAGAPLKNVAVSIDGECVRGEMMLTEYGVEGQAIYALSRALREAIRRDGNATVTIDLKPDLDRDAIVARLARAPRKASFSTRLKRALKLSGPVAALLREVDANAASAGDDRVATLIKSLPLQLVRARPIDEAISSAGGVDFAQLDASLMVRDRPGVFVAGEMLDWEAPTGGYLLQGAFSTGRAAGEAVSRYLGEG